MRPKKPVGLREMREAEGAEEEEEEVGTPRAIKGARRS